MDNISGIFLSGQIRLIQIKSDQMILKEVKDMKGYITANGYMGLVEGRYILFASEEDYREYLEAA